VTVQIALSDVVIDHTGAYQLLAPGSTPYSFPATFTASTLTLAVVHASEGGFDGTD